MLRTIRSGSGVGPGILSCEANVMGALHYEAAAALQSLP